MQTSTYSSFSNYKGFVYNETQFFDKTPKSFENTNFSKTPNFFQTSFFSVYRAPFGVELDQRHGAETARYRYSFQGQESDNEIKGDGNSINYKYRMHDPRIGRFFAIDPLAPKYPHNSPYAFSENQVISFVELEGLEKAILPIMGKNGQVLNPNDVGKADLPENRTYDPNRTEPLVATLKPAPTAKKLSKEGQELSKMSTSVAENLVQSKPELTQFSGKQTDLLDYYTNLGKSLYDIYYQTTPQGITENFIENGKVVVTGTNFKGQASNRYNAAGFMLLDLAGGLGSEVNLGVKTFSNVAKFSKSTCTIADGTFHSVAYEMKLADNLLLKDYGTHFRAANKSLSAAMSGDAKFASSMSELNMSFKTNSKGAIDWSKSPNNFVWHHDINVGVIQLVPKVQHSTGSIFWKTLHPNGLGGMATWGAKSLPK